MLSLLTINWNPDPELFNFFGISIRYYGLLRIIGLAFAYLIVQHQYRDRKIDEKKFEPLFFYCFFGILIGARLPLVFLTGFTYHHFVEMILPIKQTAAGWKMTGYTGLASHGGTLGPDYRPLDVLPQDEDALHGRARHDGCCHSHHRLLHPPCQPDELRNHRQTDRRTLGIHLRTGRHVAPPSGTATLSHRLLHFPLFCLAA